MGARVLISETWCNRAKRKQIRSAALFDFLREPGRACYPLSEGAGHPKIDSDAEEVQSESASYGYRNGSTERHIPREIKYRGAHQEVCGGPKCDACRIVVRTAKLWRVPKELKRC